MVVAILLRKYSSYNYICSGTKTDSILLILSCIYSSNKTNAQILKLRKCNQLGDGFSKVHLVAYFGWRHWLGVFVNVGVVVRR